MHPPLTLHRYPMCAEIIEDFQKCHVDHPIGKFFGKCTELKIKLDRCFRQEVASGGIGSSIENYVGGDSNVAAQSKLKNVSGGDNSTLNVSCFIGLLMELLQKVELLPQI